MQLDKLKDWGSLLTRWVLLFIAIIFAWSNLENRVFNLEATTVTMDQKLNFLIEGMNKLNTDIEVIKNDIEWMKTKLNKVSPEKQTD
jgi:HAMP domain-containing protein